MLWILPIIFACSSTSSDGDPSDQPDLSFEPAGGADGDQEGQASTASDAMPVLFVDYPVRGTFDPSGSGLVEGRVETDGVAIETLTVNGDAVSVDNDGRFQLPVGWKPGIQILGTRVESSNGERATDGRAFHAGPVHDPATWIESAIRMEIDHEILDDDDSDPDDIAGLLELALEDPALVESIIGTPFDMVDVIVTPTRVDYGRARIDLAPTDGALDAIISVDGIELDYLLDGVGLFSWFSTNGQVSATGVEIGMTLTVESAGGVIRCEASDMNVLIDSLEYDIHYVPDFLEGMTSSIAEDFIEETIIEIVHERLIPEVEGLLSGFAVGASFDTDLSFDLRLAEVSVVEEGIRFEVDARIDAIAPMALPPKAGSMATNGNAPEWPTDKVEPFWAAVDDDLMNQLAFAFWHTGTLRDIEFDAALLGAISGGPLPAPLGPADTVVMSLDLPPVLTPTQQDGWAAQVAIGEWQLQFNRKDGEVLRFSVSARSHFQTEVADDGAIEFTVDARPAHIEQAVGVLEAPEGLDPGDLAALVRLLTPPILGKASNFVPDLPVPEIALDEFLSTPATEGKTVRVSDSSVSLEENGWLLVKADIEVY